MTIVYNDKNGKYEPIADSSERISNLKEEGLITKFRLFKNSNFSEIHFHTNSGETLSKTEREERLPTERIETFGNENYYLRITHYIDDRGEHERIKCELLNNETNQIMGKSHFDLFPIFQRISINPEEKKEEILNRIYPWRYYQGRGFGKLELKEKLSFLYYELQRMERMNSPYPLPYKNKGFNVLDCWYINEIYSHFEDDLKSFVIELAKSFKIDTKVATEIYENRNDKNKWEEIVTEYEMNK
jgi:hypothetical protein